MWTITKDLLADATAKPGTNANAVGVVGPHTATMTSEQIIADKKGKKFRMKDDDGEIYYEGIALMSDRHTGFEPLDDFGTPNAGCTGIEYWEDGQWQIL